MKLIIPICLLAALNIIFLSSCSKKKGCSDPLSISYDSEAEKDDGSCLYGGQGGNATIVAFAKHHGDPIVGTASYPDSVFVKFNAINSPGSSPSDYDLVIAGEDGEDHVHIPNMKKGKYFIMMTGLDSTERVTGGIPFVLTQSDGEVNAEVPVTE